ncbi:unnamed protein product [Soboliphyme baturini]|uniref:Uncharacterized protein n=1 Tax=Soboliphyme baturini TaxID=241478 RepID=A0A183ITR9_9BILA|nr:unnamed protein product [Soboliphyme baturini]
MALSLLGPSASVISVNRTRLIANLSRKRIEFGLRLRAAAPRSDRTGHDDDDVRKIGRSPSSGERNEADIDQRPASFRLQVNSTKKRVAASARNGINGQRRLRQTVIKQMEGIARKAETRQTQER